MARELLKAQNGRQSRASKKILRWRGNIASLPALTSGVMGVQSCAWVPSTHSLCEQFSGDIWHSILFYTEISEHQEGCVARDTFQSRGVEGQFT